MCSTHTFALAYNRINMQIAPNKRQLRRRLCENLRRHIMRRRRIRATEVTHRAIYIYIYINNLLFCSVYCVVRVVVFDTILCFLLYFPFDSR